MRLFSSNDNDQLSPKDDTDEHTPSAQRPPIVTASAGVSSTPISEYLRHTNKFNQMVSRYETLYPFVDSMSPWVVVREDSPLQLADMQCQFPTPESIRRQRKKTCIRLDNKEIDANTLERELERQEMGVIQCSREKSFNALEVLPNEHSEMAAGLFGSEGELEFENKGLMRSDSSSGYKDERRKARRSLTNEQTSGIKAEKEFNVDSHVQDLNESSKSSSSATLSDLSAFQNYSSTTNRHAISDNPRVMDKLDCKKHQSPEDTNDNEKSEMDGSWNGSSEISLTYTCTASTSPKSYQTTIKGSSGFLGHSYSEALKLNTSGGGPLSQERHLVQHGPSRSMERLNGRERRSQSACHHLHDQSHHQFCQNIDPHHEVYDSVKNRIIDDGLKEDDQCQAPRELNNHGQKLSHSYGEGNTQWSTHARKSSQTFNDNESIISQTTMIDGDVRMRETLPAFPESLRSLAAGNGFKGIGHSSSNNSYNNNCLNGRNGRQQFLYGTDSMHTRYNPIIENQFPKLGITNYPQQYYPQQSSLSDRSSIVTPNGMDDNLSCETPTRQTPSAITTPIPSSSSSQDYASSVSAEVAKWRRICRKEYQECLSTKGGAIANHPSSMLSSQSERHLSIQSKKTGHLYLNDSMSHTRTQRNDQSSLFHGEGLKHHALTEHHAKRMQLRQHNNPDPSSTDGRSAMQVMGQSCISSSGATTSNSSSAITQTEYERLMRQMYISPSSTGTNLHNTDETSQGTGKLLAENCYTRSDESLGFSGDFGSRECLSSNEVVEELQQQQQQPPILQYETPVPNYRERRRPDMLKVATDGHLLPSVQEDEVVDDRSIIATKATSSSEETGNENQQLKPDQEITGTYDSYQYLYSSIPSYTDDSSILPSSSSSSLIVSIADVGQTVWSKVHLNGPTQRVTHGVKPKAFDMNKDEQIVPKIRNDDSEWSFISNGNKRAIKKAKTSQPGHEPDENVDVKDSGKKRLLKLSNEVPTPRMIEQCKKKEISRSIQQSGPKSGGIRILKHSRRGKLKKRNSRKITGFNRTKDSIGPDKHQTRETDEDEIYERDGLSIGTIWNRLNKRLEENGIGFKGIPILDADLANVYEIPNQNCKKGRGREECKKGREEGWKLYGVGDEYGVGVLNEEEVISLHLSNVDIVKTLQLWDKTMDEMLRYKQYWSRLREFEGSHIRVYQQYDELKSENKKLKEKVDSLHRFLNDHHSTTSRLFNVSIKQEQLEADIKRLNKALNDEKRKCRMLLVDKRKQTMANVHAQNEIRRLVEKDNRSKTRAKETLDRLYQQRLKDRAKSVVIRPANNQHGNERLELDYKKTLTRGSSLPRVVTLRIGSATREFRRDAATGLGSGSKNPDDGILNLVRSFETQVEELMDERKELRATINELRRRNETIEKQEKNFEPFRSVALMGTATTMATTETLGETTNGLSPKRITESTTAGEQKRTVAIDNAQLLKSNEDSSNASMLKWYLDDLHAQLKATVEQNTRSQVQYETIIKELHKQLNGSKKTIQTITQESNRLSHSDSSVESRHPENYCLSVSGQKMNVSIEKEEKKNQSAILHCIDHSLEDSDHLRMTTKELVIRDRELFHSGFLNRLNELSASQLFNIVRECSKSLGLNDPSRLAEVTERLGLAVMQVGQLQKTVKRVAEITGVQRYNRSDDIERILLNWRTTILNVSDSSTSLLRQSVSKLLLRVFEIQRHQNNKAVTDISFTSDDSLCRIMYEVIMKVLFPEDEDVDHITMKTRMEEIDGMELVNVIDGIIESAKVVQNEESRKKREYFTSIVGRFMKVFRVPKLELCDVAIERIQMKVKEHTTFYHEITAILKLGIHQPPREVIERIKELMSQSRCKQRNSIPLRSFQIPDEVATIISIFSKIKQILNLGPSPPHSDHTDRFFSNDDSNNNHDYNEPQRQGESDGGLLSAGSSESSFFSIDSKMKECADWKIWGNSCITKANLIAAYLTHNYHRGKRKNY